MEFVSGNYFSTLGVGAYLGRPFAESDDRLGAPPVLVLSYVAWETEFGRDPGIVGATVSVQKHPFTVAGVAPPGFFGDRIASIPPDFWTPLPPRSRLKAQTPRSISKRQHGFMRWAGFAPAPDPRARGKAVFRPAPVDAAMADVHQARRSRRHSPPARSTCARGQRYSETAATGRGKPAHVDDSVLRGATDLLREHCQPSARALHGATHGCSSSHGAGRRPHHNHPPDTHRKPSGKHRWRCRRAGCRVVWRSCHSGSRLS